MEEELKVGKYFRTKNGLIRKIKTVKSGKRQFTRTTETLINGKHKIIEIEEISDKKQDLLRLGDYVVLFDENLPAEYIYNIEEKNGKYKINKYKNVKNDDIKIIVSREQFEKISYKGE